MNELQDKKKELYETIERFKNDIRAQKNPTWKQKYNETKELYQRGTVGVPSKPLVRTERYSEEQHAIISKKEEIDHQIGKIKGEIADLRKEINVEKRVLKSKRKEERLHEEAMKFAREFDPDSLGEYDEIEEDR